MKFYLMELLLAIFRKRYILKCSFVAAGRAPNSKRLNLEAVGVDIDKTGAIKVLSTFFSPAYKVIIMKSTLVSK